MKTKELVDVNATLSYLYKLSIQYENNTYLKIILFLDLSVTYKIL